MAVIISEQNFENEVIKSDIPVLVYFWSNWTAACEMVTPFIDEIEKEYEGRIKVAKLDVDDNPNLSRRFYMHTLPTVILFKNGENVETIVGYRPKKDFESILNK